MIIFSALFIVKNCIAFEWPNSRAERNVTLPGEKIIFFSNLLYFFVYFYKVECDYGKKTLIISVRSCCLSFLEE